MNKVLLLILDGWGWREAAKDNAIRAAATPHFDDLWANYPHATLQASGSWVGLPENQIGSSEVGHTIIGAGRNVLQLSTTITQAISNGDFFQNQVLKNACEHVKKRNSKLHLMGLTSDGGVHSYWEHLAALITLAQKENLKPNQLCFHAVLDGRDVGPKTGKTYIVQLKKELSKAGIGRIATVSGRYWTMDRDKRWDRTAKAYRAYVLGEGKKARDPEAAVGDSYFSGITDEFIEPTIIYASANKPVGLIENGDAVISFNFRADRARQITRALTQKNFEYFERPKTADIHFACMTNYDSTLNLPIAFAPDLNNKDGKKLNLGELIEKLSLPQLRVAETEKYAHVTYFFNGGKETALQGEERVLIPSPKVATYDTTPEMSAKPITENIIKRLKDFPFMVANFANADMVGHTGVFEAAKRACECVDECLGKILKEADKEDFFVIVTADHGNSEKMQDGSGAPHTAHTTNPVPFIIYNKIKPAWTLKNSPENSLRDIAPTVWRLLDTEQSAVFEGASLIA